jgi:DNA mismatch repair ATPase MutS
MMEQLRDTAGVSMYYMDSEVDPQDSNKIRLLYKLKKGISLESYGTIVSAKAGLPTEIVERAKKLSAGLESLTKQNMANK